jgi:hypothetical protein
LREFEGHTCLDKRRADVGKVVSLTRRPLFTPRKISGRICVRGWVDPRAIMLLEGLGKLENQPHPGLETVTFRFVA